jgi:hypothetical protein
VASGNNWDATPELLPALEEEMGEGSLLLERNKLVDTRTTRVPIQFRRKPVSSKPESEESSIKMH